MRLTNNEQQKIILASGQLASVFEIVANMARSNYNHQTLEDGALRLTDMFSSQNADGLVDLFKNIYNRRDL